ncbi:MAG TPA: C-terminal binding protein [Pirellulaceae bacterium]|nr:C-terminal binding protein [Pirellulaceae bacterium]
MSKFRVLLTDYAWADLEIERRTLAEVDAELIVASAQDETTLIQAAAEVDAIMTCWAKVTPRVLAASPKLRIVSRLGIGLDNIDVAWCSAHGVPVTNVPDYCVDEVAEHTIALVLGLARKVAWYHHETKQGRYQLQSGPALRRVAGQTLGIIGLGNIGRQVARRAEALGLKVIAAARRDGSTGSVATGTSSTVNGSIGSSAVDIATSGSGVVTRVPLDELLATSDYVSLHLPLVPDTRRMIGANEFQRMKPTAYLINTSRGGLVDHAALAEALAAGRLAGAALDVQDPEPPDLSQPPYNDPRVIVTPHAAFVSIESLLDLRRRTAIQVATRLTGGQPENIVNRDQLAAM